MLNRRTYSNLLLLHSPDEPSMNYSFKIHIPVTSQTGVQPHFSRFTAFFPTPLLLQVEAKDFSSICFSFPLFLGVIWFPAHFRYYQNANITGTQAVNELSDLLYPAGHRDDLQRYLPASVIL